jgi:hypothetical protein
MHPRIRLALSAAFVAATTLAVSGARIPALDKLGHDIGQPVARAPAAAAPALPVAHPEPVPAVEPDTAERFSFSEA